MTISVNPIANVVTREARTTTINLSNNFDDTRTTGLVARFQLYNTALGDGITDVVLFDQQGAGAPLTVQNFVNYVASGAYTNSIIHRSVPGFIIQGGGFTVSGLDADPNSGADDVSVIPTNPPVQNEFSSNRSNLRGTIAMAKLGGNPNSATNQWFFNLANNSANLDNQNGGFTVFGQVVSNRDLATLDAIAALPVFNGSGYFGQPALETIPLIFPNPANPTITGDANVVRYRNISLFQVNELRFDIVRNSNPRLLNAAIDNNRLVLSYNPSPVKTATLTIRATNLLGQSRTDAFVITVQPNPATPGNDVLSGTNARNDLSGLGGNDQIFGFGGNDQLVGQAGRDALVGGTGTDTLTGGAGGDRFVFDIERSFRQNLMGIDVVADFRRPDKIVLDSSTFTALQTSSFSFRAVGSVAQAQSNASIFTYVRSTGALYYNPNGRAQGFGGGGQFADFQNGLSLAASDFVVQA